MKSDAFLSEDRKYRYWLLRIWNERLPVNCICGLNPSTADEWKDDPTIRRDMGFSARQGFGGLLKVNLSAFRSTDPRWIRREPIGEKNTAVDIRKYFVDSSATQFIAAWGRNGRYLPQQVKAILDEFPEAMCFGKNPDGSPRHTLMLPYSTALERVR